MTPVSESNAVDHISSRKAKFTAFKLMSHKDSEDQRFFLALVHQLDADLHREDRNNDLIGILRYWTNGSQILFGGPIIGDDLTKLLGIL